MNNELKNIFNNSATMIEDFIKGKEDRTGKKIPFEKLNEHNLFNAIMDDSLMDIKNAFPDNYNEYVKEFRDEIEKYFTEIKTAEPAAIDYYVLSNWLKNSRKIYEESRFNGYKKHLREKNEGHDINQLDAETELILNSCHSPRIEGSWDRRGLVYGHVQSGKTANYVGLINRALDHGYKIIIVLTGMTEDLRRQTQERIDDGIVWRRTLQKDIIRQGTNRENDLSKREEVRLSSDYSYKDKSIWVIKKNKTVLDNLIRWINSQIIKQGGNKLENVPVLIIDDEADNASIQSLSKKEYLEWEEAVDLGNKEEEDLTEEEKTKLNDSRTKIKAAINTRIRAIMSLISQKTFVAYTATPYNIIVQDYEDIDREVLIGKGDSQLKIDIDAGDLFPEHFIIPIKPGDIYVGIDRIFNTNNDKNIPVKVNIDLDERYKGEDYEHIFPTKRGLEYIFEEIPKSLKDAILFFLVSIVIKKYRGMKGFSTMLIHTSHLTVKVDYVADKVDKYLEYIKSELKMDGDQLIIDINSILIDLKTKSKHKLFKTYFSGKYIFPESISKQDIINTIEDPKNMLDVIAYHSSKSDTDLKRDLNYDDKIKDKSNYIVVGGNRLSRGLTLKGLTTSYFVRSSTRQDSLYQMGRWFGYRPNYEDLIRIFLPSDHIFWFESIFEQEQHLRDDFEKNNNRETLPKHAIIKLALFTLENDQFVKRPELRKKFPYVCDPNKTRKTIEQSLSHYGVKVTNIIQDKREIQDSNFEKVINFFEDLYSTNKDRLFNNELSKDKTHNVSFSNIDSIKVINFLKTYKTHPIEQAEMESFIEYASLNMDKVNGWSVSLVNRKSNNPFEPEIDISRYYQSEVKELLKIVTRNPKDIIDRKTSNDLKGFRFLDGGTIDTHFDLLENKSFDEIKDNYDSSIDDPISREDFNKKERNKLLKPLLLIIPVEYEYKDEEKPKIKFPLLYIYYPMINDGKKVKYIYRKKNTMNETSS